MKSEAIKSNIIPNQRREFLIQRIYEQTSDDAEREIMLTELETASESDADDFEVALAYLNLPYLH